MALGSGFTGQNSNRANTAFTIGVFTILGAWAFQYIGGYMPCELCYAQRTPYYIGLPLLAVIIGAWKVIPVPARIALTLVAAGIFVWGTYLGAYHAGVEWGFWPGPTSCTGTGEGVSFSDLSNIDATRVVPCDKVQWRFLGLSFAGYNALISAIISGFLAWSVIGQIKRYRREGK
jgi:disulfide bond formation protein DsbB